MTFRKISRCSRICNGSARSTRRKGASTFSFHFLLHPPSYPRLPIFFLFLLFPLFSFVSTIHRASSNWSEFALREREYREKIFSFRRPTVISTCRMIDILWKCLMLWLDVKKRMKKTRTKEVWWQRERERERDSKRDEMETEERQTGGRERLSQNDELNDVFVFSRGDSQHPGDERDSTLFLAPCLYFLFLRSRSTTSPLRRVLCSSLCSSFRFCLLVYPSTGWSMLQFTGDFVI